MKRPSVKEEQIRGFSLDRDGPKISLLFFVNDSLLFCQTHLREVQKIQQLQAVYEKALRQKINSDKTTLFFGKLVSEIVKNFIKDLLGVPEIKQYKKYFGLPAVVDKNRRACLNYIKDRVWGKLQG